MRESHSAAGLPGGAWLVEYLAYWEENLTAGRLAKFLGITREHAQRAVLQPFVRDYHVPLQRSRGQAKRLADGADGMRFAPTRPSDLVHALQGMQVFHAHEPDGSPFSVRVEDVGLLTSADPEVEAFKALYAACANGSALAMEYRSKQELFSMAFSPHAIVTAPARMHFRGYAYYPSGREGGYIDVVPSRVTRTFGERPDLAVSDKGDVAWSTLTTLRFHLSPALPEHLKAVVLEEWSGQITTNDDGDAILSIASVRQALALYVRRGLRYRTFNDEAVEVWLPLSQETPVKTAAT